MSPTITLYNMKYSSRLYLLLILLISLLIPCNLSLAAEKGGAIFNFNNVNIRSVIKSVALLTNKNFIIDPAVTGKVTIISSKPMADDEIYGIFLSILRVYNYTAVENDDLITIMPLEKAKQNLPASIEGKSRVVWGDDVVTRIYQLEHMQADKLVPILKPLMNPKSFLATHPDSNSLIFIDSSNNISRLLQIIKRIDQQKAANIEIIPLQYADARDVIKVLTGLEPKASQGKNPAQQLNMIADERTNSILLSGADRLINKTKGMITYLDTAIESEGSTQVVFLRHAKAEDLVPILTGLQNNKKEAQGRRQKGVGQSWSDVLVNADPETNALIITSPPAVMKTLLSVVRKLDIRRGQVMIEAVLVEVSIGKAADLGVQWSSTSNTDGSGIIGGTQFSGTQNPLGGINNVAVNPLTSLASGLNIGYFNGTTTVLGTEILNLGALVSALSEDSNTNILSTPSLVTLDNQEAEIIVGQNLPFVTGSYTSASNGNPDNPFTTIERQDVGIKLKIKPQINDGNTIRLQISQEISKVVPSPAELGLQITDIRSIETTVVVDDRKILVLGGLISDSVQDNVQKVPILGDIPYLGSLFRYTSTKHEKKNLMVFIRPVIIRNEEVSKRITFNKYEYMRMLQHEFKGNNQIYMRSEKPPLLPELELSADMPYQTEQDTINSGH